MVLFGECFLSQLPPSFEFEDCGALYFLLVLITIYDL